MREIWADGAQRPMTQAEEATFLTAGEVIERRLIAKSTVQERVNALGKLGDAFAALQAQPISFGRWFAPDWPQVYADDPGLLGLLQYIGLTAEQIAAVTAE
jgi:hypothetical protein